MDKFDCPACTRANTARHHEYYASHQHHWYICSCCHHAYRTLSNGAGENPQLTSQSPRGFSRLGQEAKAPLQQMLCPGCGNSGRVKMTERRDDGYYRRHKCRGCAKPYFSRVNNDGLTIFQKMPSNTRIA